MQGKKTKLIILALLSILAFVFFYGARDLAESPPTWYDEGMILQLAKNLSEQGSMMLQLAPGEFVSAWHVSTGYPVVVPVAAAFKIFGIGIVQARGVAILFMLLLIAASFLLLRRLFDSQSALWGAFLISTFSSLYGNGKNVLGEVPGLFFFVAFLLFFNELERSRFSDWRYAIGSGIAFGLTCATKPIFLLIVPAFALSLLASRKNMTWKWAQALFFAIGAAFTAVVWVIMQFGPADSIASILHFYVNPYDVASIGSPVLANIRRFFTEATPIYTILTFAIWSAALIIRRVRKSAITIVELCAFIFAALILIAYLRMPGWYRYLFPANIVTLAFLPQALTTVALSIFESSRSRFTLTATRKRFISYAPMCAFLIFQSYYLFWGSWISTVSSGTQSSDLSEFGRSVDKRDSYFVFDVPQVVPFLQTDNYYQYFSGNGVWVAGGQYLDALTDGIPNYVLLDGSGIESAGKYLGKYGEHAKVGRYAVLKRRGSE